MSKRCRLSIRVALVRSTSPSARSQRGRVLGLSADQGVCAVERPLRRLSKRTRATRPSRESKQGSASPRGAANALRAVRSHSSPQARLFRAHGLQSTVLSNCHSALGCSILLRSIHLLGVQGWLQRTSTTEPIWARSESVRGLSAYGTARFATSAGTASANPFRFGHLHHVHRRHEVAHGRKLRGVYSSISRRIAVGCLVHADETKVRIEGVSDFYDAVPRPRRDHDIRPSIALRD